MFHFKGQKFHFRLTTLPLSSFLFFFSRSFSQEIDRTKRRKIVAKTSLVKLIQVKIYYSLKRCCRRWQSAWHPVLGSGYNVRAALQSPQLRYIFFTRVFHNVSPSWTLNLTESADFQGQRLARSASFFSSGTLFPKGSCTIHLAKCDSNGTPLASFLIFVTGGYM